MLPTKPKSNSQKKPPKKIKILQVRKRDQRSFFSFYFYQILLGLFAVSAFFLMGVGFRWDEALVIALWIAGILFVCRQAYRMFNGDPAPAAPREKQREKEKKEVVLAGPVTNYKAPETPRVSKDFSPVPPRGVKGYPPPSPFIKPPK